MSDAGIFSIIGGYDKTAATKTGRQEEAGELTEHSVQVQRTDKGEKVIWAITTDFNEMEMFKVMWMIRDGFRKKGHKDAEKLIASCIRRLPKLTALQKSKWMSGIEEKPE